LLAANPRSLAVLNQAAKAAGWGPLPSLRTRYLLARQLW
jgi:hypothetical protein